MTENTNNKAVIVWVDDYFGSQEFEDALDNGVDFWQEMFGGLPEKIYRLFNIDLKIFSNQKDALEYINAIPLFSTVYYFFILDLSLPKDVIELKNGHHSPTRGKQLGKTLFEKKKNISNIDFVFLSSASGLNMDKSDKTLSLVSFYIKENSSHLTLPEPLRHKIMMDLRNNLHWIEISKKLKPMLSNNSTIYQNFEKVEDNKAFNLFPYFDKFKEFVNLNELDSYLFEHTTFIKSCNSNCPAYEQQCLLLMFSELLYTKNDKIQIDYYTLDCSKGSQTTFFEQKNNITSQINKSKDENGIVCLRLKNINRKDFIELDKALGDIKLVYIVSNEENYEEFLEYYQQKNYTLKELPYFQHEDKNLKQNLLFHMLRYLLIQIITDMKVTKSLYIEYPHLLLDPYSFTMLSDPSLEISSLSDSYEIVREVLSLQENTQSKSAIAKAIKNDLPLNKKDMLNISMDYLGKQKDDILRNTLLFWLENSWNYSYGINLDKKVVDQFVWQKQSYQILKNLFLTVQKEEVHLTGELTFELNSIQEIILNKDFQKIIDDDIDTFSRLQWDQLLASVRWPHTSFPMPSIIHSQFEKYGKHLWMQENKLNYVQLSSSMLKMSHTLNDKITFYENVIEKIKITSKYLPNEISNFASVMLDLFNKKGDIYILECHYKEIRKNGWASLNDEKKEKITRLENDFVTKSNSFVRSLTKVSLLFKFFLRDDFSFSEYKEPFTEKAKIGQSVSFASGFLRTEMPLTLNIEFIDFNQSIKELEKLRSKQKMISSIVLKDKDNQVAVLKLDFNLQKTLQNIKVNDEIQIKRKINSKSSKFSESQNEHQYKIKNIREEGVSLQALDTSISIYVAQCDFETYNLTQYNVLNLGDIISMPFVLSRENSYLDKASKEQSFNVLYIDYENTYIKAIDILTHKSDSSFDHTQYVIENIQSVLSQNKGDTYSDLYERLCYQSPIDYLSSFSSSILGLTNYMETIQYFDTQKLMYMCQYLRNNYEEHLTMDDKYTQNIVPNLSHMMDAFIYSYESIIVQFQTIYDLKSVNYPKDIFKSDIVVFTRDFTQKIEALKANKLDYDMLDFKVLKDEIKFCIEGIDDCFMSEKK